MNQTCTERERERSTFASLEFRLAWMDALVGYVQFLLLEKWIHLIFNKWKRNLNLIVFFKTQNCFCFTTYCLAMSFSMWIFPKYMSLSTNPPGSIKSSWAFLQDKSRIQTKTHITDTKSHLNMKCLFNV